MNWSDLVVIAIIGVFGIIGLINGFIYSIFRLASYFASIIIAVKFYPVVSGILMKTAIFVNIKASILKNLLLQGQTLVPKVDSQAKLAAADKIIDRLPLPGFFKTTLIDKIPQPSKLFDLTTVMDNISGELAGVVIDIMSLVLLYILVRIALIFIKFIIKGIAKLPVFKQMDKMGGFAFGAVEGLLTVYIVCAVLMLFNASPQFLHVFEAIDNSVVAKFFYQNNFIVNWMFPKMM